MKKKIGIILSLVILTCIIVVGYLTIIYTQEDYKLEREINELSKLDITKDSFNRKYVTSGDYKKVEKAIKDYLNDYSTTLKNINDIIDGDKFSSLLSYENLSTDKSFRESIIYVNRVSSQINTYLDKLVVMCSESNIRDNISKYNLDEYYVNLYNKYMLDQELLGKFKLSSDYIEQYRQRINNKVSACNEIFLFLNNNINNIKFEEGQLKFNSEQLINQYNEYINKIKA